MKLITFTDGASRGNPGPASIGVLVMDQNGKALVEDKKFIGITTNNEAEYRALILALEHAVKLKANEVDCFMDSELVVRQLSGQYKVKSEKMAGFHARVRELAGKFETITFSHVRREHPNQKVVDALANQALDERGRVGGLNA